MYSTNNRTNKNEGINKRFLFFFNQNETFNIPISLTANSPFQIRQKFLAENNYYIYDIGASQSVTPQSQYSTYVRTDGRTHVRLFVPEYIIRTLLVGQCDRSVGQSVSRPLFHFVRWGFQLPLRMPSSSSLLSLSMISYISPPCSTLLATFDCEVRNSLSFLNAIIWSHYSMHGSLFLTIHSLTSLHNSSQLRQRVCKHYPKTTILWYCKLRWTEDSTSASFMKSRWQSVR